MKLTESQKDRFISYLFKVECSKNKDCYDCPKELTYLCSEIKETLPEMED